MVRCVRCLAEVGRRAGAFHCGRRHGNGGGIVRDGAESLRCLLSVWLLIVVESRSSPLVAAGRRRDPVHAPSRSRSMYSFNVSFSRVSAQYHMRR